MVTITQVMLNSFYLNLKQADTMADTTVTTTRKVEKENKPVKKNGIGLEMVGLDYCF